MATSTITPEALRTTIDDIVCVNAFLDDFWGKGGWAPSKAAGKLSDSRLDRQTELSRTLSIWRESFDSNDSEGRLILAWANLGALVEGTMKWFLCVFEHDYAAAPETDHHGNTLEPDDVWFARLCNYFADHVWSDRQKQRFHNWSHTIRKRRNTIHAYSNKPLGTWDDWRQAVVAYLKFLVALGFQVPYPDEQFAMPCEVVRVIERVSE